MIKYINYQKFKQLFSGGAERLVVDAALGLQQKGHHVDISSKHNKRYYYLLIKIEFLLFFIFILILITCGPLIMTHPIAFRKPEMVNIYN